MEFRPLRADEIEVRADQFVKNNTSCIVLLYKNARCDMNVLDECVGAENWQRLHYSEKSSLFCKIGIWVEKLNQWVWKSDAGAESSYAKAKGEASDSFKRAGTNWGIGRELYTAPKIFLPQAFITTDNKGKHILQYDTQVTGIDTENGHIKGIEIMCKGGCYQWGTCKNGKNPITTQKPDDEDVPKDFDYKERMDLLSKIEIKAKERGKTQAICEACGISKISDMSEAQVKKYKELYKL